VRVVKQGPHKKKGAGRKRPGKGKRDRLHFLREALEDLGYDLEDADEMRVIYETEKSLA
jgi:hypothetical protein